MTKKISKVIIYYEDGTYEEVKASVPDTQGEQNKTPVSPSPVIPPYPDLRPDYYKIREYTQPVWVSPTVDPLTPPWTVTCNSTDNVTLNYTINPNADTTTWSFTSTGNADNLNKYTITSTGNGNVDLSK